MSDAVVHLVRHVNGLAAFDAFLTSYEAHDAGLEHDLVLLFKGFPSEAALAPYRERAAGLRTRELHVPDEGLDLGAYLRAAQALDHDRLCFLNSHSEILVAGWLRRLGDALASPGAGLVGATGSWGSHRSFALFLLHLPNGYRGVLGGRAGVRAAFNPPTADSHRGRSSLLTRVVVAARDIPREIAGCSGFPAPHVRTNAFMIERALLLSLRVGRLRSKSASYRFEAGRHSLTAQVRSRGFEALVVRRDGTALPPERWAEADVFWQGEQEQLLVADNRTRAYRDATPAARAVLARYAWGNRAGDDDRARGSTTVQAAREDR